MQEHQLLMRSSCGGSTSIGVDTAQLRKAHMIGWVPIRLCLYLYLVGFRFIFTKERYDKYEYASHMANRWMNKCEIETKDGMTIRKKRTSSRSKEQREKKIMTKEKDSFLFFALHLCSWRVENSGTQKRANVPVNRLVPFFRKCLIDRKRR